jgi:hypothetical protein
MPQGIARCQGESLERPVGQAAGPPSGSWLVPFDESRLAPPNLPLALVGGPLLINRVRQAELRSNVSSILNSNGNRVGSLGIASVLAEGALSGCIPASALLL